MRLQAKLEIEKVEFEIVDFKITLELMAFGRAELTIRSEELPVGLAEISLGFFGESLYPFFQGMSVLATPKGEGVVHLLIRELSSLLETQVQVALRHPKCSDVLAAISRACNLTVLVDKSAPYLETQAPYFYSLGNGRQALENFELWGVKKGIWFQRPDGKIWWGSWDHSLFATMPIFEIPEEVKREINALDTSFVLPPTPTIRPGVKLEENKIVSYLEITPKEMRLKWLML